MGARRALAIVRHDLRILRSDPTFLVVYAVMPLLVMAFVKPAYRMSLVLEGVPNATGAEQAVPGIAVMFAFFVMGNIAFGVFREHGWNTWPRLRASPARPVEIMSGKAVVPLVTVIVQLSVLFAAGAALFGLRPTGSYAAIAVVGVALAACLVALGFVLLAVCRTILQLNAAVNLGAVVMAGLGGCLTPMATLPQWARAVAPATPSYWAMRGLRSAIVDGAGVGGVAMPVAVLIGFAALFAVLGALRFRVEDTKLSWA